jgi:putative PIN family toxin of toxin-antitoxin system
VADLRVIADSNVLVSALLWTGIPHEIVKLAEKKKIRLYSSLPIIEEISEVLIRPKFIERIGELKTTPEELIEALLSIVEVVHPTIFVNEIKTDADDNRILECGIAAGADFIVSGDPHLLRVKSFRNIPIVTPRKFIELEGNDD